MKVDTSKYEKEEIIKGYVDKIKQITDNFESKFETLTKEITAEMKINQEALAAEVDKNIAIYHRYLTRLAEEKRNLIKFRSKRDEIEGELQDYYRFSWDKSTKLSETAISKYVAAHPVFVAVNNLTKDQEALVSYLDGVVSGFRDRGFAIKNLIDLRKIELGLN